VANILLHHRRVRELLIEKRRERQVRRWGAVRGARFGHRL